MDQIEYMSGVGGVSEDDMYEHCATEMNKLAGEIGVAWHLQNTRLAAKGAYGDANTRYVHRC